MKVNLMIIDMSYDANILYPSAMNDPKVFIRGLKRDMLIRWI